MINFSLELVNKNVKRNPRVEHRGTPYNTEMGVGNFHKIQKKENLFCTQL